jgi:hypothetical protein
MRRIHRGPVTAVTAAACVAALAAGPVLTATGTASAATTGICTDARHPYKARQMSRGIAAVLAARGSSFVGLAVSDPAAGLTCAYHQWRYFYSASVVKATILSALLFKKGGPGHLTSTEHSLAFQMITASSNSAATALWNDVGINDLQNFLNAAGMHNTILDNSAWGLTQITAHDELTLLQLLSTPGSVLNNNSRNYVLRLMAEVEPFEAWGVSEGAPSNVTVHIKNGWLPYPDGADWRINSIGVFTGTGISYQMAILTDASPGRSQGEGYGIETIEQAAAVVNSKLAQPWATSAPPPASPPPASPAPTTESVLNAPGG